MIETIKGLKRSHTCGELRKSDTGKEVILMGWVGRRRDHGGVIFIDLRDRYGITQVVFNPRYSEKVHRKAEELRQEAVIAVRGKVEARPEGMANLKLATGEIEVNSYELRILNGSKIPPFPIDTDIEINEETRLRYRYLDLRRPSMQQNLILRHKAYQATREFLANNGFIEVETPFLMKSTPEGARDYLVPSRLQKGKFYALPQSPQTYKQILMVAGFDRYFQIARCFRDEDLRADRQPEFTQIDIEMSFIDEEDIFETMENLVVHIFKKTVGLEIEPKFPRLTYQEAMSRYGSDKPDTRFGLEIVDVGSVFAESEFQVFKNVLASGGQVKGINAKGCGRFSRKELDDLNSFVKEYGAKGLASIKIGPDGPESSIVKFFSSSVLKALVESMDALEGDLLLFVADQPKVVAQSLGHLRLHLARQLGLIDNNQNNLLWVTQFPLLEFSEEEKRFVAMHHPFTSPVEEDIGLMDSDPGKVRARAYDLVWNGNEIAGGSIRIHNRELQSKMFALLGISSEEAQRKFGFLLEAFEYGAPPHGGIAFGFDRLCALLVGVDSIREVIAFPKTNSGISLMDNSPSEVDPQQLRELGLNLR